MKTMKLLMLVASLMAGAVLSACSTGSPGGSPSIPAVSLPAVSVDPSAATEAVTTILNELDSAIASNQTPTGLTVEEQAELQGLATSLRTAVQTGDLAAAKPAFDALSAKVDAFAAKLDSEEGAALKDAVTQLRALLATS